MYVSDDKQVLKIFAILFLLIMKEIKNLLTEKDTLCLEHVSLLTKLHFACDSCKIRMTMQNEKETCITSWNFLNFC